MKKILVVFALLASVTLSAQEGIKFEHGTWTQTVAKAKAENKLIFLDVYTQWCGPCYNMSKNIFTLYSVGSFYNDNFINIKLDAENGEGVEIAKKYKVNSYPTYLFIDPKTEAVVHASGGNQPAETFIYIGKSALDPKLRSTYLESEWTKGNKSPEFLLAYANYKGSRFDRKTAGEVAVELSKIRGYGLDNIRVWNLYEKYVTDRDNALAKELFANTARYRKLYGDRVDKKLASLFNYVPELQIILDAPEFASKEMLIIKNKADLAVKAKDYKSAAKYADQLMEMAAAGKFEDEIFQFFTFFARSAQYGDHPDSWKDKCFEICRFNTYNNPDRDNAQLHYEYAKQLEQKMERMGKPLGTPEYGKAEYDTRPRDLKQKPKRR